MDELPIQLSQASGVPFYRQVTDQIAEMIRSGRIGPGTRLPSFRDLAPQLRVSLITVRRAYTDLQTAGLIVRKQGQGTFVAEGVESLSRERALEEARAGVEQSLVRARQLGLTGAALRRWIDELLSRQGDSDE